MKVKITTNMFEVEILKVNSIIVSGNDSFTIYSENGKNVFYVDSLQDFQFVKEEPTKTLSLLQVTRYIMKAEGLCVSEAKAKAMEMMR